MIQVGDLVRIKGSQIRRLERLYAHCLIINKIYKVEDFEYSELLGLRAELDSPFTKSKFVGGPPDMRLLPINCLVLHRRNHKKFVKKTLLKMMCESVLRKANELGKKIYS